MACGGTTQYRPDLVSVKTRSGSAKLLVLLLFVLTRQVVEAMKLIELQLYYTNG